MKENGVVPYSYQTMQCATQASSIMCQTLKKNKNYIAENSFTKTKVKDY